MSETKTLPPEQQALNDLRKEASTAEDNAYLDAEQQKLDAARAEVLGHGPVDQLVEYQGVVTEKPVVEQMRAEGQDVPNASYENGHR